MFIILEFSEKKQQKKKKKKKKKKKTTKKKKTFYHTRKDIINAQFMNMQSLTRGCNVHPFMTTKSMTIVRYMYIIIIIHIHSDGDITESAVTNEWTLVYLLKWPWISKDQLFSNCIIICLLLFPVFFFIFSLEVNWVTTWENVPTDLCTWLQSSLSSIWKTKDPWFRQVYNEGSDKTSRLRRLILVFARRTCLKIYFYQGLPELILRRNPSQSKRSITSESIIWVIHFLYYY